jgi:hypothetical protein
MPPFYPGEEQPGIMKDHGNPGKFIEGRNQGLYFSIVNGFALLVPTAHGGVINGAQDTLYFIIHSILFRYPPV